jgi:K(+)-stimulated pyrophosphate-energized sodium pump
MNPVIKFTTLFGLLAVELAVTITAERGGALTHLLAVAFFVVSLIFVWRSFYRMRIRGGAEPGATAVRSGVHEAARGN